MMQTMTKVLLIAGMFACLVISTVQANASKPKGATCEVINGACVSVNCSGECGPVFPDTCACIR